MALSVWLQGRLMLAQFAVSGAVGYKCRLDENSWLGANRKILENELIMKQHMLANIEDLDRCCEKAGVQVTVEVKAGLHPKMIVVEEAKKHGAYHVILDRYRKPLIPLFFNLEVLSN